MSYSELLKDPRWQRKRLDILNRDNFTCVCCGDDKSTLHVHHQYYINGRMPWEYSNDLLITLCAKCHENEESLKEQDEDVMKRLLSTGLLRSDVHNLVGNLSMYIYNSAAKSRTELKRLEEILYSDFLKNSIIPYMDIDSVIGWATDIDSEYPDIVKDAAKDFLQKKGVVYG